MRPHYTSAQVKWHHSPSGEVENGHGGHLLAPQVLPSVIGFMGDPRARVVAADLNTSGAKDFVVYKIRVGDDSGCEWTVSRRYRHFEVLHRQLRSSPGYAFKLPPKRIFIHTQNADFVEDRRQALDAFLQELLRVPELASSKDLWEFLRAGSERFEAPRQGSRDVGKKGNLRRGLSKTVLHGAQSIGRGVVGATVDVTQAVTHGVKTGVSESVSAAVGGVGAVLQEAKSSLGIGHRRSASVPEELEAFDPGEATAAPKARKHSADPLMRAGTGLLRTATASARKVKNAFVPHGPTQSHGSEAPANPKALFSGVFAGEEQAGRVGSATSSEALSPDKRPRGGARTKSRSRNGSPTKMRRAVTEDVALPTRTVAFTPATGLPHAASWAQSHGYAYAALDMSGLSDPHAAADATIEVDAFGQGSPMSPASPPVVEYAAGADAGGLDWDACAGISGTSANL